MSRSSALQDVDRPRRPLKVRDLPGWSSLGERCLGLGITPNMISLLGLGAGIGSGLLLAGTSFTGDVVSLRLLLLGSLLLFLLRGFCNVFDGIMAVEGQAGSPVGALYNEVPDRVSDAAVLIGAGYALGGEPFLGWAAALLAVFTAYVRVECRQAGAAADYGGLFGKPGRMVVLAAALLLLLLVPGLASQELRVPGGFSLGVLGLATAIVLVGSSTTAAFRLARAARQLRG